VWTAVLGSVKLFPNLATALKGVFNRVLKNLRKASASGTEITVQSHENCHEGKMLAIRIPIASFKTSGGPCSKELMTNELNDDTRGTPSEPLPSRDSRSTCDSLRPKPRHDRRSRVPAHRLRVQTSPTPNRSNCPRRRASEYCSAKAGRSRAFPNRCVLRSVTHGGPTV
jgi:hypothetical protein